MAKIIKQEDTVDESPVVIDASSRSVIQSALMNRKLQLVVASFVIICVVGLVVFLLSDDSSSSSSSSTPEHDPFFDEFEFEDFLFEYTPDERNQLFLMGAETWEIEMWELAEIPFYEVMNEQQRLRDRYVMDRFYILSEELRTSNPPFDELYNLTWISGVPRDVNVEVYQEHKTRTENARFIKVPPHGNQLFIKVTFLNETVVFMTITPERWMQLPDDGNIVLRVQSVIYDDVEFIVKLEEISI